MDKYGIIGNPLGQSKSKPFFNQKFADEHIDAVYETYELPSIEKIEQVLLHNPELKGFNVTIPYKEKIIPYLANMSDEATAMRAVNVVKVIHEGTKTTLAGYNTDVIGFTRSIQPLLQKQHTQALILGTGGVSKAVAYGLSKLNVACRMVSRTAGPGKITYEELTPELMNECKVIVNCTPLGMYSAACPAIPYEYITPEHLLFDTIYNPPVTLFMEKGAAQGATVKNGYEMWLLQALASWEIWNR